MIDTAMTALCALGIPVGLLLMVHVPLCDDREQEICTAVSIIVPARNEEHTLPVLLRSLDLELEDKPERIIVDDQSSDATVVVATDLGAQVISSPPLPDGWTGKTWACETGASAATNDTLLFLDADTWFSPKGLERLLSCLPPTEKPRLAVSVLPFHQTERPYEELSLFFNLMMAFGAGGFGLLRRGRLFGQSLLLSRQLYQCIGAHATVRGEILENLALASQIRRAGGGCRCFGGRGVLNMRMFPHGFSQLCEGWMKAFATGAAASDVNVLIAAIYWLSALFTTFLWVLFASGRPRMIAIALYICFVAQIWWMARQLGSFRSYTCILYPLPLSFFFVLFARSFFRKALRRPVTWRGRQL